MPDTRVPTYSINPSRLRPFEYLGFRLVRPSERIHRICLIAALYSHRVVRRCSAKSIPPHGTGDVRVSSGIDQYVIAAMSYGHAERIRVTVASPPDAERASIDDRLSFFLIENSDPGIWEKHRGRVPRGSSGQGQHVRSQPPQRDFIKIFRMR